MIEIYELNELMVGVDIGILVMLVQNKERVSEFLVSSKIFLINAYLQIWKYYKIVYFCTTLLYKFIYSSQYKLDLSFLFGMERLNYRTHFVDIYI